MPAAADVVRRRTIASFGNEGARRDHIAACPLAVESEMHEASRPQQRIQDTPGRKWIGHVMENAGGIDHIEGSADRSQLEDIGLGVFESLGEMRRCLSLGVA